MVALGSIEQPGPFNEAILGAVGMGMIGAGFRRWRKAITTRTSSAVVATLRSTSVTAVDPLQVSAPEAPGWLRRQ